MSVDSRCVAPPTPGEYTPRNPAVRKCTPALENGWTKYSDGGVSPKTPQGDTVEIATARDSGDLRDSVRGPVDGG